MKSASQFIELTLAPIVANQILQNYKRDRDYFEQYSPQFNNEFLVRFEEEVDTLVHLTPLQLLEKEITDKNGMIQVILSHFRPLLNIVEELIHLIAEKLNLPVDEFGMNELRESINRKIAWEVQRNSHKMVSKLELHADELIDKGYTLRILNDFHVLMEHLRNAEFELADVTHQHDLISNEYLLANHELKDIVETIIEASPAVFGEFNVNKMEEYSIEKLMTQAQFNRSGNQ